MPTFLTDFWADIGKPVFTVKTGPKLSQGGSGLAGWDQSQN